MQIPSQSADVPPVVRPAKVEFVQWGKWSADAPPRDEMERRAVLLQQALIGLAAEPLNLRIQVSGGRSRWYFMSFGPPCVTLRVHWWLLQWPTFVGRMSFQTLQAQKLPLSFDSWISARAADFPGAAKQRTDLEARGNKIDLNERLAIVSKLLDDPARRSEIHLGWGRRSNGTQQRSSVRLGSMNIRTRTMLIHPVLDEPRVPLYVVDMVVWHELCHWICPPRDVGQHNRIHHPEFRQLERRYPDLDRAEQWIKVNFAWLARNA